MKRLGWLPVYSAHFPKARKRFLALLSVFILGVSFVDPAYGFSLNGPLGAIPDFLAGFARGLRPHIEVSRLSFRDRTPKKQKASPEIARINKEIQCLQVMWRSA